MWDLPLEVKNASCHLSFRDWMWGYYGLLRANLSTLFLLGCTLLSVAFMRWSSYLVFVYGMLVVLVTI